MVCTVCVWPLCVALLAALLSDVSRNCSWMLTGILVAVHVIQVARFLAQDNAVETLVHKTVVVLDKLPYQLGRHDKLVKTFKGSALGKREL